MTQPIAWLRDLDGTGSYHPCAEGDPWAFPVYGEPQSPALKEALEAHEAASKSVTLAQERELREKADELTRAALRLVQGE